MPPLEEALSLYRLPAGQLLARIHPEDPALHAALYHHLDQNHHEGLLAAAFIARISGNQLSLQGSTFGSPFTLRDLLRLLCDIPEIQIEGPLADTPIPGDLLVHADATPDQLLPALERLCREDLALPLRFQRTLVERPVTLLQGRWHFTPITPDAAKTRTLHVFGHMLNPGAGGGSGSLAAFAHDLARYIQRDILINATDAPAHVHWELHGAHGTYTSREAARETHRLQHDPKNVLARISAQTALTPTEQARPLPRLLIVNSPL